MVCNGDNDGKATITVSGGETPYTMSVNGGASISITGDTHTLSDLEPVNHNVIITDAHGCTFHLAFDIDEPTPLFAEIINFTDVSCDGGSDGTATVMQPVG